MSAQVDHYAELELEPDCTEQDIRAAFSRLQKTRGYPLVTVLSAKKNEKGESIVAVATKKGEKIVKLSLDHSRLIKAFICLSNPDERAKYDRAVADAQSAENNTAAAGVHPAEADASVTGAQDNSVANPVAGAKSAENSLTTAGARPTEANASGTDDDDDDDDNGHSVGTYDSRFIKAAIKARRAHLAASGIDSHTEKDSENNGHSLRARDRGLLQDIRAHQAYLAAHATASHSDNESRIQHYESMTELIKEILNLAEVAKSENGLDDADKARFKEAKKELVTKFNKDRVDRMRMLEEGMLEAQLEQTESELTEYGQVRQRMFEECLKKQTALMEERKAKEKKAAQEREEKEAAREASIKAKAEACVQKDLMDKERLASGHERQFKVWAEAKADTPEAKKKSCLHAHTGAWSKNKLSRKFKCEACSVKRGITSFTCPYCDMAVCQMCLGDITSDKNNNA